MYSASEVAKCYGRISKKIKSSPKSRIVVIKNNKPDHIILDIKEYEFLQELYETLEHKEIAELIRNRESGNTIPIENVLENLGISENEISD
jgi:PHD/YefM family antitoxin component YafN of YafNO toxin-antitoxin module